MFLDPLNMGLDTLFVESPQILTELWAIKELTVMADPRWPPQPVRVIGQSEMVLSYSLTSKSRAQMDLDT